MERKQPKKPDALFTADWHLREDTPVCRTDPEFQTSQWNKVDFISKLQRQYKCPILHSGDLFNHWKPSPALLTKTMKHLPDNFHTIYGNHDLPQHNLELADKCGINVLKEAGKLEVMDGTHWGQPIKHCTTIFFNEKNEHIPQRNILVWHTMTFQGKKPWPDCVDPKASKLLRKYPEYDLIVTGHNHQTFVEEHDGRLLVNPGSLTRQEADKDTYEPCVFLYYAETNTVKKVLLPFDEDVVSRDHLTKKEQRDHRLEAFVSKLKDDWETAISFEENVERMIQANKINKRTQEIIQKAIDTL
jgi:DNA repair exonuclease SbcCD nuclease subunit